jgi:hypothetical protein
MMLCHFSIITVVRDDLVGLKTTAAALAAQSHPYWHWWVIDASTPAINPNSLALRPHYYHHEAIANGPFPAMNKALSAWQDWYHKRQDRQAPALEPHEYLWFLHSGETPADQHSLAEIAKFLCKADPAIDLLITDHFAPLESKGFWHKPHAAPPPPTTAKITGQSSTTAKPALEARPFSIQQARQWRHIWRQGMPASHQAMFYQGRFIGQHYYPLNWPIAGDYAFTIGLLAAQPQCWIASLPCPLVRTTHPGLSAQFARQGRLEQHQIRRHYRDWLGFRAWHAPWLWLRQNLGWRLQRLCPWLYRGLYRRWRR